MKEEEIDKYVGTVVKVKWFDNDEKVGELYKVFNGKVNDQFHAINKGYSLYTTNGWYDFRKSHIKKINIVL